MGLRSYRSPVLRFFGQGSPCENGCTVQVNRFLPYTLYLLALGLPVLCLATSIARISLEDTVAQAEWIVEGDVVRNWCGWDSGHRFIWTHTEVAVRDRWKGTTGRTVTISEPGGSVNGIATDIPGMVRYTPGEHVVVFLYTTPIGLVRTVGLAQGKLEVDNRGRVHPARVDALLASPAGARADGTSVHDLDASSLSSAHQRIVLLDRARKAVRK